MKPVISSPARSRDDAAFAESLRLISEIQTAIRNRDVKLVRQKGDLLKGAITSVLAKAAFEAASTLEKASSEDQLVDARDACQRLEAAIQSLNAETLKEPVTKV
ncbi:MAG TPA: hypothetical protein VFW44_09245 [Bryobacteraceae bacterium]|nr:hypothetical protein [Bryobacteraceae bacterium]